MIFIPIGFLIYVLGIPIFAVIYHREDRYYNDLGTGVFLGFAWPILVMIVCIMLVAHWIDQSVSYLEGSRRDRSH